MRIFHKLLKFILRKDSDKDGLSDYEEIFEYGTNPHCPDSDQDGVSDGEEVRTGRNPLGKGKLKKLFIPIQENGYTPELLLSSRIIFYALSSLMIKMLTILFLLIIPITAWLSPNALLNEKKEIINLTNDLRNELGLFPLQENDLLDNAAYNKAEDMLKQQYFSHISPQRKKLSDWLEEAGYDYSLAGENLALGFLNPQDVVDAWKKSKTHYDNLVEPEYRDIGVGVVSGKYHGEDSILIAQYFGAPKKKIFGKTIIATSTIPVSPSGKISQTASQYFFIKNNPSFLSKPFFFITSLYYKFLLLILGIAFFFNIFIEIKKQKLKVIFSSFGLLVLLFLLIII